MPGTVERQACPSLLWFQMRNVPAWAPRAICLVFFVHSFPGPSIVWCNKDPCCLWVLLVATIYVALLSFLLISFVCLKKLMKGMMQNLVSWRACFFYSFSVGSIIFSARRQKMSAFLEISCAIYWKKCMFLVSFLLWDMWVVGVLCIAFRYVQWGFSAFCSWINASGCWVGYAPLVLVVHCGNMCVRWFFFWSMALKCVSSITVLWLWFALIN